MSTILEDGFEKGQSDNLPKVDYFMVFEYLNNHVKYTSAEIRGWKLQRYNVIVSRAMQNWFLVEWETHSYGGPRYAVVNLRLLVNPAEDLHTGKRVLVVNVNKRELQAAKIVMCSDDPLFLKRQLVEMENENSIMDEIARYLIRTDENVLDLINEEGQQRIVENTPAHHEEWETLRHRGHQNSCCNTNCKVSNERNGHTPSRFSSNQRISGEENNRHSEHIEPNLIDLNTFQNEIETLNTGLHKLTGILNNLDARINRIEQLAVVQELSGLSELNNAESNNEGDSTDIVEIHIETNGFESNDLLTSGDGLETQGDDVEEETFSKSLNNSMASNSTSSSHSDMRKIGTSTYVPNHVMEHINWNSYTMATRKLLVAVFPRRILATHSLTGKSSPAFRDKPAKLSLDPRKVSDVVSTVVARCKVAPNVVRSVITTKCADENKMYQLRLKKRAKRKKEMAAALAQRGKENLSPEESGCDLDTLK